MTITAPQLRRLQVLYTQYERHSLDCPGASREARLLWASKLLAGRTLASFSELSVDDARHLIDTLQARLGVKAPNRTPRRKQTRRQAEKMGTEGRRDQKHNEATLAGADDVARIQRDLDELGWQQAQLDKLLEGTRNPIRSGRRRIVTLGDANNVHWALKGILRARQSAAEKRREQATP